MRKLFKEETVCFLITWILLIYFGRSKLLGDPGTFWHITVGQHILGSHHFMTADIFSFTFQGKAWIASSWLIECLMALIYAHFGFDGLLIVTTATLACLYTWLLSRLLRSGLHILLAGLVVALFFAASSHNFLVRPHIISIAFLALTFVWLCDYEAGRIKLRGLFWLWPLFIIWTNIHGAVLAGLGTLGLTLGGWTLVRLFGQDSPVKTLKDFLTLGALLLGCILTIFLNPYGIELPRNWFAVITSSVIPQVIQEHASLFREPGKNLPVFAAGLFFLACLLGTLPRRPRVTWLIPLVWLVLACSRVRNAPLFAVTAILALAEFMPQVRWVRWLSDRGSVAFRVQPSSQALPRLTLKSWLVPGAIILLTVMVSLASLRLTGHALTRLDSRHWPVELLPELTQYERAHPLGAPIMNDILFGGFLIFYTPRLQVFVDDRCDLYGDEFLLDYTHASPSFFAGWLKKSGAQAALTEPGSPLDRYFKCASGWRLEKQTAAASFYRKSDG